MARKKLSLRNEDGLSQRFNQALIVMRLTEALAKADGWDLDQLNSMPAWLRALYDRHADAACKEIYAIEKSDQPRSASN